MGNPSRLHAGNHGAGRASGVSAVKLNELPDMRLWSPPPGASSSMLSPLQFQTLRAPQTRHTYANSVDWRGIRVNPIDDEDDDDENEEQDNEQDNEADMSHDRYVAMQDLSQQVVDGLDFAPRYDSFNGEQPPPWHRHTVQIEDPNLPSLHAHMAHGGIFSSTTAALRLSAMSLKSPQSLAQQTTRAPTQNDGLSSGAPTPRTGGGASAQLPTWFQHSNSPLTHQSSPAWTTVTTTKKVNLN